MLKNGFLVLTFTTVKLHKNTQMEVEVDSRTAALSAVLVYAVWWWRSCSVDPPLPDAAPEVSPFHPYHAVHHI